jgi:RNA polymerase sigma-70 factor (ECF subfamily)
MTFEPLFSENVRYVGRTLRYLGVREADLDDACQEVFIVVHRRLHELAAPEGVRAWIRQICVHVAQNARRSVRRRREDREEAEAIGQASPQESAIEKNEMRDRLIKILDGLSDEQRAVFVLYEIEQLKMPEIAEALGCNIQTAYSRLHAARDRVKEAVKA